jgi:regulator of protease activity HflC (stomatin/prohibitin superfamily)
MAPKKTTPVKKSEYTMKARDIIILVVAGIAGLFTLSLVFGCFYTVGTGEAAIKLRYGQVVGPVSGGLGFKLPWVETVNKYSTAWHTITWDKIEAYSKDQQPGTMKVSISWQLNPDQASCMPSSYQSTDNIETGLVQPKVQNNIKNVFGTYTAAEAINQGANLTNDIAKAIEQSVSTVEPCGKPIVQVQNFNLEDVAFSDAYEKSVEERMIAEIQVAKAQQQADQAKKEADKAFNEAVGRAKSVEREADAQAHKIEAIGKAEANAIALKGAALRANPEANPYLIIAQKWNGQLPTSMIPGSTVPFMKIEAPSDINTGK